MKQIPITVNQRKTGKM